MNVRPSWLTVIGRKELEHVIEENVEITGNYNQALKIVLENASVDILLIPVVQLVEGIIVLSYKAVSTAEHTPGEIVAKSLV